jgi:hypothetical protein
LKNNSYKLYILTKIPSFFMFFLFLIQNKEYLNDDHIIKLICSNEQIERK